MNDGAPAPESPRDGRSRWLRREAINLGDVVVQIFAVVVGILLALFIDDWSNQRQQRVAVNEAMRAIRGELATNRIALRIHAEHMFQMAEAMRAAQANRNQPPRPCFEWDRWNGIGGMNLTDAAYQTAIATQALANMPFKQAQTVAQIYGWQHYFQKGEELDMGVLTQGPQRLELCAGFIEELGRNNLQLDAVYATLIGPDTAPLPKPAADTAPPAPQSAASPSSRNPP